MTIRVGQRNRNGEKLVGYNVYRAPDGCGETYFGRVTSLRAARAIVRKRYGTAESDYGTYRAAGEYDRVPDRTGEDAGSATWFGRDGYCVAVPVFTGGSADRDRDMSAARADYDVIT